jgi:hypothetical protein
VADGPEYDGKDREVLESPHSSRSGNATRWLVALAVIGAGVAGYLFGVGHASTTHPTPPRRPASDVIGPVLTPTGRACSVKSPRHLQLGFEVANTAHGRLHLGRIQAELSLRDLRQTSSSWATCGQLNADARRSKDPLLRSGHRIWLTVTFHAVASCPAALPVQFLVHYTLDGQPGTAPLPGFSRISHMSHRGCLAGSPGA